MRLNSLLLRNWVFTFRVVDSIKVVWIGLTRGLKGWVRTRNCLGGGHWGRRAIGSPAKRRGGARGKNTHSRYVQGTCR